MHFLPFADQILCLNSAGQQCEQGTFEQLKSSNGYVEELVRSGKTDPKISLPPADFRVENLEIKEMFPGAKEKQESQAPQDKSRQLGDWATYRYYFASLGWWCGFVFMALQVSYAFFMVFPSEIPSHVVSKAVR